MIVNPILYQQGTKLPELENPGSAADLLAGKQLVDQYGNPLTGTMPQKSAADLTASGASVIVPAGYYPSQVSKSVATAAHPKPTISRSGGTVTAQHVQSAGYTSGGTTTETLSIPTQAGKTVTPTTYAQTAVASGRLTTGAVTVAGDANLAAANIKSGVSIFGVAGSYAGQSVRAYSLDNAALSALDSTGYTTVSGVNIGANSIVLAVFAFIYAYYSNMAQNYVFEFAFSNNQSGGASMTRYFGNDKAGVGETSITAYNNSGTLRLWLGFNAANSYRNLAIAANVGFSYSSSVLVLE